MWCQQGFVFGRGERGAIFHIHPGIWESLNETMGSSNSFQFKFLILLADLFSPLSSFYTKLYLWIRFHTRISTTLQWSCTTTRCYPESLEIFLEGLHPIFFLTLSTFCSGQHKHFTLLVCFDSFPTQMLSAADMFQAPFLKRKPRAVLKARLFCISSCLRILWGCP